MVKVTVMVKTMMVLMGVMWWWYYWCCADDREDGDGGDAGDCISYSLIAMIRYHDQPTYRRRELGGFMAQGSITITVEKHSWQSEQQAERSQHKLQAESRGSKLRLACGTRSLSARSPQWYTSFSKATLLIEPLPMVLWGPYHSNHHALLVKASPKWNIMCPMNLSEGWMDGRLVKRRKERKEEEKVKRHRHVIEELTTWVLGWIGGFLL